MQVSKVPKMGGYSVIKGLSLDTGCYASFYGTAHSSSHDHVLVKRDFLYWFDRNLEYEYNMVIL